MTEGKKERKKISPYPDKKDSLNENIDIIFDDDVVEPTNSPEQLKKQSVYLEIIIDGTYSMSKIYSFLYDRLIGEVNELKKINADIFIKTIVVYDKNNIRNMGNFGNVDKFKNDLLSIEFCGGSYDGFEPCLNDALVATANELENIENADLKGILLVTDSMPGTSQKPDYNISNSMCDFAILFVNEPDKDDQFIDLNGVSIRDIRNFLGRSKEKVLYTEIDRKIKLMEKNIW